MSIDINKRSNKQVIVREGVILFVIMSLGLLIIMFSPSSQYPQYVNLQEGIGIHILVLVYPFYWLVRLIVLVIKVLNKKYFQSR
ncbi:MAG: hypothetical protein ABIH18_05635 [Candidatus Omnitrophota bacterium]